jgi:hypothetical protein
VTLLLHSLDLEDYAQAFALAKINGRKLKQCSTREELKEDWDVDMPKGPFRLLRAAVEEYAPSGVPTALLEEARGRVEQQQSAPAPAPVRDEAAFARLKAQAPQKVNLHQQCIFLLRLHLLLSPLLFSNTFIITIPIATTQKRTITTFSTTLFLSGLTIAVALCRVCVSLSSSSLPWRGSMRRTRPGTGSRWPIWTRRWSSKKKQMRLGTRQPLSLDLS